MDPKILDEGTAGSGENPAKQLDVAKTRRVMSKIWVVLVVLLVGAGAVAGGFYLGDKKGSSDAEKVATSSEPTESAIPTQTLSPTATATPTVQPVKDIGVTWLAEPQKLDDLKLFSPKADQASGFSVAYYKTGDLDGQDLILAAVPGYGIGDERSIGMFLKKGTGYELIEKNSPDLVVNYAYSYDIPLAKGVGTNKLLELTSIILRERIMVKGIEMERGYDPYGGSAVFFSEIAPREGITLDLSKFDTTPYGDLYRAVTQDKSSTSGTQDIIYYLKRPNGTIGIYQYSPPIVRDDGVPQVTWLDGSKNKDTYRLDGGTKCGSGSALNTLPTSEKASLTKAGTAGDGRAVYALPDTSSVVKFYYDTMGGKYIDAASNQEKTISLTEWQQKHGIFVYEDLLGRLIVYRNTVYGLAAECGKPVVYLYPTKTTDVSVQVAANIRISEPEYGNGWKVTAQPNGTLTTADGKKYGSLFWEGTGDLYPSVKGIGTVVAKSEVESTLKAQLKAQGLNAQETADFLEFWLPKMPSTPYVRLTWLGTREMDRLAPLNVSPKPDSVIRVFLDFEGLQEKIQLKTQNLSAIPRNGFTVVEWGGLLMR